MCFCEFIGYGCGHTSVGVNRTCPLTTALYTNPACPKPGCRPFLSDQFCFPCSRIFHARRLDIAEHVAEVEHRWMHNHGACGCPVVFPPGIGPTFVQRESGGSEGPNGGDGPSTAAQGHGEQTDAPPLWRETEVGGKPEVGIRRPSLYAPEWTGDHAKEHKKGKCKCNISFKGYKPHSFKDPIPENHSGKFISPETSTAWGNVILTLGNNIAVPPYLPIEMMPYYDPNESYYARYVQPTAVGEPARYVMSSPENHPFGHASEALVDVQTVHVSPPEVRIPGHHIGVGLSFQDELPSTVEYPQPEDNLAAFPIGAGPEGQSHAGSFDNCRLNVNIFGPQDEQQQQQQQPQQPQQQQQQQQQQPQQQQKRPASTDF
ncbi:hypothetical protein F4777DRAFT_62549 [Nemania sp. FL0916]|nr:hypothetical protein F4777DRAFT_62549 [Nemania sp. FL0916]